MIRCVVITIDVNVNS